MTACRSPSGDGPSPSPSASPKSSPTGASPTPTATPSASPTPKPSPSASPKASPSPSATPTPKPTRYPDLGVVVDASGTSDEFQIVKNMGAKWVRAGIDWPQAEPVQGQIDFSVTDRHLDLLRSKGFKIYFSVAYTPAWASTNGKTDGSGIPNVDAWKTFMTAVMNRYKDRVDAIGVWNEANLGGFWSGTAQQFVDTVLKPGCSVIRSIKPNLIQAGPELAHLYNATISVESFMKAIKNSGAHTCFDVISHHIYAGDDMPGKVNGFSAGGVVYKDGLKQWLDKSGLWGKPVWITEFGVDAHQTGEAAQTKRIPEQFKFMGTIDWIDKAFIYNLHDDPRIDWEFGVIGRDGKPRPFAVELQKLLNP